MWKCWRHWLRVLYHLKQTIDTNLCTVECQVFDLLDFFFSSLFVHNFAWFLLLNPADKESHWRQCDGGDQIGMCHHIQIGVISLVFNYFKFGSLTRVPFRGVIFRPLSHRSRVCSHMHLDAPRPELTQTAFHKRYQQVTLARGYKTQPLSFSFS